MKISSHEIKYGNCPTYGMLHLPSQETVHRDQNESEERDDIVNKKKGGSVYEKDITDQNGRSNDVAYNNHANLN